MPELPEVETTVRALGAALAGHRIVALKVRNSRLRWPVPADLPRRLAGARVLAVRRRAKYLLIETEVGTLLVHLGMSGRFCLAKPEEEAGKHDHVDLIADNGRILRYTDPRRFGAFLWAGGDPAGHPLLRDLGPEPLGRAFDGDYLFEQSRGRKVAVKLLIMDARIVVGVGNIYANEALFRAGIRPTRAAGQITRAAYDRLADAIRQVLREAIAAGGTTLRDFAAGERQAGYFRVSLQVYGRGGEPCLACGRPLVEERLGGRSTVWCRRCQR
jgi:formamidopyrimidine-DNA glycosylase